MIPQTLQNNPSLDRWVSFPTKGRVRVAVGKSEYGQGMLTGLAQIAAEELDVAFERLDVVNLETGASPDEGLTVGSMSTEMSGASIRAASAEVRALFAEAAASRLGCTADELDVDDGAFLREGERTGLDYWALAAEVDLARAPGEDVKAKSPDRHTLVGTSQPRIDLPPKLFGAAFLHDLALPGMLHARVLRQPGPAAKLTGLDEAAVRRAAGADIDILRDGQFVAFISESEPRRRRGHRRRRGPGAMGRRARPLADALGDGVAEDAAVGGLPVRRAGARPTPTAGASPPPTAAPTSPTARWAPPAAWPR